ncbi:MAG: luciferase family protein [Ilumatobacteraceae bacterium]|nr:luciferase family protein [Ilumatobacteraceae bacterium]MCU1390657.1 luciferase family protein [Ilumatobacteraceae bacterium]
MECVAVLPTNEIGHDTGAVKAWAQAVEALGYDRIIAYDHVLGAVHEGREPKLAGPYTENDPFREPMVFFGYLAGVTTRVELMPGVIVLPQRQTALVAKQAAEVDLLSGGRFVLGVGTGWNFVEYESLNEEYRNRARRMDEQIEVMRALWSERVIDFTGKYHRIDRAGLYPLPERQIPIWFGGHAEPALRRCANVGDGHLFGAAGPAIEHLAGKLRTMLTEAGRDPASFPMCAQVHTGHGPEALTAQAESWKALGGSHISVSTMSSKMMGATARPCATVDDHIALLDETLQVLRAV